MMKQNRGFTLLETIVATALSVAVLSVGYSMYIGVFKAQNLANQRESMMLSVQNVMSQIKRDVRSSGSVSGNYNTLILDSGKVSYKSLSDNIGIERKSASHAKRIYNGVSAEFGLGSGGVSVKLRSNAKVQRRPINIEISSFITPRNN